MNVKLYTIYRANTNSKTLDEAADHVTFWMNKSEDERLNAARFIINQVFGVTPETKVNREITAKQKQA
jgi:hypothetical protein